jgi:hypothetical protein
MRGPVLYANVLYANAETLRRLEPAALASLHMVAVALSHCAQLEHFAPDCRNPATAVHQNATARRIAFNCRRLVDLDLNGARMDTATMESFLENGYTFFAAAAALSLFSLLSVHVFAV